MRPITHLRPPLLFLKSNPITHLTSDWLVVICSSFF